MPLGAKNQYKEDKKMNRRQFKKAEMKRAWEIFENAQNAACCIPDEDAKYAARRLYTFAQAWVEDAEPDCNFRWGDKDVRTVCFESYSVLDILWNSGNKRRAMELYKTIERICLDILSK